MEEIDKLVLETIERASSNFRQDTLTQSQRIRVEALDLAMRHDQGMDPEEIVEGAEKFAAFIEGENNE